MEFIHYFGDVFTPVNFLILVLGTVGGLLLGATPGIGDRLGLSNDWAYNMIKAVGNYGEIYDRTVGEGSPYKLPRGLNNLWSKGGLHYTLVLD